MIKPKENALRIIRFNQPEYVMTEPPVYELLYHGCNHEGFNGGGDESPVGSMWVDIWGTQWNKIQNGFMGLPVGFPLAEMDSLRHYRWPDPSDERICGKIYRLAESFVEGDSFLAGAHRDTLWEKAYMLVGMENMMVYFLTEPEYAKTILSNIMDFQLGIAKHYIELGVEMVRLGDDLGSQQGLMFGPHIIEEFLKPEYERIFQFYREHHVLIRFHSCGYVEPLLDMFIRLGVDILHPVQATANNLDHVREVTQGHMAMEGCIPSHLVLDGPIEDIEAEVGRRIRQLGQQGGFFCRPDQTLDYPKEHVGALEAAVRRCGTYPLT